MTGIEDWERARQAMQDAVAENMTRNLFTPKALLHRLRYPPTRWERVKRRLDAYRYRIVNAWLVLIGRAFVDSDY